jgi:hypothetical protein
MLEAMARITPSQPNDAMARIASRRKENISLGPYLPGQISERFFRLESKLFSKVQIYSKKDWVMKRGKISPPVSQIAHFYVQPTTVSAGPPCIAASF